MEMRLTLLFMAGIIALHITAEKCRQLVGEEASSKSRTERFTFLNCFDMSYGTIACAVKEIVKLYFYYIRAAHVHKQVSEATEAAMREKLSEGQSLEEAVKWAYQKGNEAKRRATRQAKHIMGPVISSAWDFFETIWVGGTLAEGAIRGTGTFFGSYAGGVIGEGRLGWVGFLAGSQMGSWVGGRIGLMAYDVGKGIQYLLHFVHNKSNYYLDLKDSSL
ncbi:uncharacterized protein LOC131305318 [Rhododendron vialii]|uniref:uncharacterized protein LOC131305318 n=1 Tax=Rhododendron vialii TaxID=182163 RepID=UPI00265DA945|nr:uncharacterized protein LOC131305318 [Rhododendron vialii]